MKKPFLLSLSLYAMASAAPIHAEQNNEAIIKYRHAVMESIGGEARAIGEILKNKMPNTQDIPALATGMKAKAALVAGLFPEGSGVGKTGALPEIWKDAKGFKEAVTKFQDAAAKLADIAPSGDLAKIGEQMKEVGQTCGGCHKTYRKKDHG